MSSHVCRVCDPNALTAPPEGLTDYDCPACKRPLLRAGVVQRYARACSVEVPFDECCPVCGIHQIHHPKAASTPSVTRDGQGYRKCPDCGAYCDCFKVSHSSGDLEERAEDAESELWLVNQRIEHLEGALKWFADEGHYTGTYRLGAGYVDAVGLTHARAGLLGMDPDDADAVEGTWSVSHWTTQKGSEAGQ